MKDASERMVTVDNTNGEPPLGWEVPDLYRKERYDVGLVNTHTDGSKSEVWWAIHIDMVKATEAITELFIMKVKAPDAFKGNIVIRPTQPITAPQYHGSKCEEDSADDSSGVVRNLQSVGGDRTGYPNDRRPEERSKHKEAVDIGDAAHRIIQEHSALDESAALRAEDEAAQRTIELAHYLQDQEMIGECCGLPASRHSKVRPFRALLNPNCKGWDSGE